MECTGGLSTEKGLALEAVYVGADYHDSRGTRLAGYSGISPTSQGQHLPFLPEQAYLSSSIIVLVQYR